MIFLHLDYTQKDQALCDYLPRFSDLDLEQAKAKSEGQNLSLKKLIVA